MLAVPACVCRFECMLKWIWAFSCVATIFFVCAITKWMLQYLFAFFHFMFCAMWTHRLAQSFIYSLAFFFAFFTFYVQMLACLIFWYRFVHHFISFFDNSLTFTFFVCLQVPAGATSSLSVPFSCCCSLFFLPSRLFLIYFPLNFIYNASILLFLLLFLTRSVLAFFAVQITGLNQFALARFRFFWGRCLFFFALSCS